ncbi:hypothetical protein [Candidatus Thiosymbion oneisti]|uniref:hypothetical protein n=1 Tax=Candidatus Thiosymbion oneisti TaxID=589554 RepID=UPI000ACA2FA1|nr:hypothetical protein [Candidatus Thiosymbion oneisti]
MKLLTIVASWASITGGVIALFSLAEKVTQDSAKERVSAWLKNIKMPASTDNWAAEFGRMFDAIFGERHLSIRCFLASSVASVLSVVIISILIANIMPNEIKEAMLRAIENSYGSLIGGYLILVGLVNLLPDYVSLLETRLVISIIGSSDKPSTIAVAILLDAFATLLIWLISILLFSTLLAWLFLEPNSWWSAIQIIWEELLGLSSIELPIDYLLITLAGSTYFTSVWIWLYLAGGGAVKLYYFLTSKTKLFFSFLDLERRPFLSLGFAACILITILFAILSPVLT